MSADHFAVIRARRAEIAHAIELLKAEDEDLATTELVLRRLGTETAAGDVELNKERTKPGGAKPTSQRQFVLTALAVSPAAWLRTPEIVSLVSARWGVQLPEASLRPLLSVLKREKLILRRGRFVALRERAYATSGVRARGLEP